MFVFLCRQKVHEKSVITAGTKPVRGPNEEWLKPWLFAVDKALYITHVMFGLE